jgi:hypothetical protein
MLLQNLVQVIGMEFFHHSGAWRIRKRIFQCILIDDLKIRANYGILGSSNIGYWDWVPLSHFSSSNFGQASINTGMIRLNW